MGADAVPDHDAEFPVGVPVRRKTGSRIQTVRQLLSFELDEPSRSAVLSTAYTVSALDGKEPLFSSTLTNRIPVEELSADAFARAMEQAVSMQIADIKKRILDSVKPQ